jgi:Ohr subfamily peroxiredoxin
MNTAADMVKDLPAGRVLYTARVHTTGGRDGGVSQSDDRRLEIRHSVPGKPGNGTNPEQLFAAGWSACFEGAMGIAASKLKMTLPADTAIDAEIDLLLGDEGYAIAGRLNVSIPGVPRDIAQKIVSMAETFCPYSKATRGNMKSTITVV